MARIARIVVPGHPHHVTQRGNRRLEVFFGADDYRAYRRLLGEYCARAHLAAVDDGLGMVEPLLAREAAWRSFLDSGVEAAAMDSLRQHSRTGRPAGSESYLDAVEAILQRPVKPRRPGRPRKTG